MTTTWDRIDTTDNGQAFKTWLTNRMITEEVFNEFSFEEIDKWRTKFDQQQQQQPNEQMQEQTRFVYNYIRKRQADDETVQISKPESTSTPYDFLNRGTWSQAVRPTLSSASPSAEDENDERKSDMDDGMDHQKKRAPTQSDQAPARATSGARNTSGSDTKGTSKQARGMDYSTEDSSLDFMDEEEQRVEEFRAFVRNSLNRMFPPEEIEEVHNGTGPPRDIVC